MASCTTADGKAKRRYLTRREAVVAIKRAKGHGHRLRSVYRCEVCGLWHGSSKRPGFFRRWRRS